MNDQTARVPLHGGTAIFDGSTEFAVWSRHASRIELCLFDDSGNHEIARLAMERGDDDVHRLFADKVSEGARYGYRAHGVYAPDNGLWFGPSKLLVDPYATVLDRPFVYDPRLGNYGEETADLVPKAIVTRHRPASTSHVALKPGALVYEVNVRGFTMLHSEVPEIQRGTVAAMAHPSVIAHLKKLGVDAVELMPVTAWIDERHLPPLGLRNSWGYNPVAFMALDPRLAPGGVDELRDTVARLHEEGIAVILDLVFNHTGESDRYGPTLSLRGLDNLACYRHQPENAGVLVNDTGTGNTVACEHPFVRQLMIDSLRHFVEMAGVDGFRFDLAPIMFRTASGFDAASETARALLSDPVLRNRILIAEPWDIGPGGYQVGNFPEPFLEWNDRVRDDIRRYWRGDPSTTGALADALAGSSGIFSRHGGKRTRTVNFLAAHDGFTLADVVSYEHKHNEANGENNRDGHNENHSWNNGAEGATDNQAILEKRRADLQALLSTLFATRGTIMLTAGDEGGRSQGGNNNAYAQDNAITWFNWDELDESLLAHTAWLSAIRKRFDVFGQDSFFTGENADIEWLSASGQPLSVGEWEAPSGVPFAMIVKTLDRENSRQVRLGMLFNRSPDEVTFCLTGGNWRFLSAPAENRPIVASAGSVTFIIQE